MYSISLFFCFTSSHICVFGLVLWPFLQPPLLRSLPWLTGHRLKINSPSTTRALHLIFCIVFLFLFFYVSPGTKKPWEIIKKTVSLLVSERARVAFDQHGAGVKIARIVFLSSVLRGAETGRPPRCLLPTCCRPQLSGSRRWPHYNLLWMWQDVLADWPWKALPLVL